MGKHRAEHSDADFAEDALRPATVEELAAAERAQASPPPVKERVKRPLLIAGATAAVLLAGASAVALARADADPIMVPPLGDAVPFGIGYVDGFGEHSPRPTQGPDPRRTIASRSASPIPALAPPTDPAITVASPPAALAPSSPAGDTETAKDSLVAVYWLASFRDSYDIYVWVHNGGSQAADWKLRIELPAHTTISTTWAARKAAEPGNVWIFSSPRGTKLSPGRTYLFAFEGRRPAGTFALRSCSVNGVACARYGAAG